MRMSIKVQVEASSAYRGIGIVKLMGKQSGFIAVKVGRAARELHAVLCCAVLCCNYKVTSRTRARQLRGTGTAPQAVLGASKPQQKHSPPARLRAMPRYHPPSRPPSNPPTPPPALPARQSALAFGQVDVCLIPEVKFTLEGENGLLAYLEKVLDSRGHAIVCLAESAAQVRRAVLRWRGRPCAALLCAAPLRGCGRLLLSSGLLVPPCWRLVLAAVARSSPHLWAGVSGTESGTESGSRSITLAAPCPAPPPSSCPPPTRT